MKFLTSIALFLMTSISAIAQNNFLQSQLKFERVKQAYDEKWNSLKKNLVTEGYNDNYELCINAYKSEEKLEVWLKKPSEAKFRLFKIYDFCEHSGTLGPKVMEGDLQTPEGFYQINIFNPESSYHLSLGIDYPNNVDLTRTGPANKPGGDIYIHGNCVTVGCIPLTDEKIKEVYLLAIFAKNGGQNTMPVNIFPFKMDEPNMKNYSQKFPQHVAFWQTLKQGYLAFEQNKFLPKINPIKGKYVIK